MINYFRSTFQWLELNICVYTSTFIGMFSFSLLIKIEEIVFNAFEDTVYEIHIWYDCFELRKSSQ